MFSNPFYKEEQAGKDPSSPGGKPILEDTSGHGSGTSSPEARDSGSANVFRNPLQQKETDKNGNTISNDQDGGQARTSVKDQINVFEKNKQQRSKTTDTNPPLNNEGRQSVKDLINKFSGKANTNNKVEEKRNENVHSSPQKGAVVGQLIEQYEKNITNNEIRKRESENRSLSRGVSAEPQRNDKKHDLPEDGNNRFVEKSQEPYHSPVRESVPLEPRESEPVPEPVKMFQEFKNPYKENVQSVQEDSGKKAMPFENINISPQKESPRMTAAFGQEPIKQQVIEENKLDVIPEGDGASEKPSGYDRLLDDVSVDADLLNISTVKPVMNNPVGLNKSILDKSINQSELNIWRRDISKIHEQQAEKEKEKNKTQPAWDAPINQEENFGNINLDVNLINFEDDLLVQKTEDTVDLSQMGMPKLKNALYQRDNSYYLNMTKLDKTQTGEVSQIKNNKKNPGNNKSIIAKTETLELTEPGGMKVLKGLDLTEENKPNPSSEKISDEVRHTAKFGLPQEIISLVKEIENQEKIKSLEKKPSQPEKIPSPIHVEASPEIKEKNELAPIGKDKIEVNTEIIKKQASNEVVAEPKLSAEHQPKLSADHQRNSNGDPGLSQLDISKIDPVTENFLDGDEFGTGERLSDKELRAPNLKVLEAKVQSIEENPVPAKEVTPKIEMNSVEVQVQMSSRLDREPQIPNQIKENLVHEKPLPLEVPTLRVEIKQVSEENLPSPGKKILENPFSKENKQETTSYTDRVPDSNDRLTFNTERKDHNDSKSSDNPDRGDIISKMKNIYSDMKLKSDELHNFLQKVKSKEGESIEEALKQDPQRNLIKYPSNDDVKPSISPSKIAEVKVTSDEINRFIKKIKSSDQEGIDRAQQNEFANRNLSKFPSTDDVKLTPPGSLQSLDDLPSMKFSSGKQNLLEIPESNKRTIQTATSSPLVTTTPKFTFESNFPESAQELRNQINSGTLDKNKFAVPSPLQQTTQKKENDDFLLPSMRFTAGANANPLTSTAAPIKQEKLSISTAGPVPTYTGILNFTNTLPSATIPVYPAVEKPLPLSEKKGLPTVVISAPTETVSKLPNLSSYKFGPPITKINLIGAPTKLIDISKPKINDETEKMFIQAENSRPSTPAERRSTVQDSHSEPRGTLQRSFNQYTNPFRENSSGHNSQENSLDQKVDSVHNTSSEKRVPIIIPGVDNDEIETYIDVEPETQPGKARPEIKIKLKFKSKGRSRPQIFDPRATTYVPQDTSFDVNMIVSNEDKPELKILTVDYHTRQDIFRRTLFGFPVKPEKFIRGVDERKIESEGVDIVCINCQELVSINNVDQHSKTCFKFNNQSKAQEVFIHSPIFELDKKIQAVIDKIFIRTKKLPINDTSVATLNYFLNRSRKLLENSIDCHFIENLVLELQELANHLEGQLIAKGYVSFIILINRVILLGKEKCSELELAEFNDVELQRLQAEIQAYERETLKQKAELELWKYQSEMMHEIKLSDEKNLKYVRAQYKNDLEVLSDIESGIDYSDDESSITGSSVTSAAPLNFENNYHNRSSSENAESERLKVKFYSTAVNLKLGLQQNHPGKDVLISDLYEKAKTQKVSEFEWTNFLKKEFGIH